MKSKSIIKSIHDPEHHFNQHIAAIEGRVYVKKPTFFRNTESGEEYYYIIGSIAFPVGNAPGFAVVIGVLKEAEHDEAPRIVVLEEIEEKDLVTLLTRCEKIRWKWGYPHLLSYWVGDAEHFRQAIATFNSDIEDTPINRHQGIYLIQPSDFEQSRRDSLYLQTIRHLLSLGPDGCKRLLIGNNPKLRAHLQNVPPDLGHVEDIPALASLAYACHTILASSPWLEFTKPELFFPTIQDQFIKVDIWPWNSWDEAWDDYGHETPFDDGSLIDTIFDRQ